MKAKVDKNLCMGCGICTSICPEIFELGEDGKASAKDIDADCVEEAADSCPEQAITIS